MPHIMLVEDEPHIIESLTFLLNREGFEVTALSDGEVAYASILEKVPDVLVLDVMLPGLTGFEILRRIRNDPDLEALPVLMLTAKGQRRDRETAEGAGANRFMTKPFSNADLIAAVKALAG